MVMNVSTRESRLNVLLTEDRPRAPEHWIRQLPRLLAPQGVTAYVARSGQEAIALAERVVIHAAIIDMATPVAVGDGRPPRVSCGAGRPGFPAGMWLVELFRRLPQRPPVIVVRGVAYSQKQVDRLLKEAMRLGVFSVVNAPADLEQILAVFRRLIDRQYRGHWPTSQRPKLGRWN